LALVIALRGFHDDALLLFQELQLLVVRELGGLRGRCAWRMSARALCLVLVLVLVLALVLGVVLVLSLVLVLGLVLGLVLALALALDVLTLGLGVALVVGRSTGSGGIGWFGIVDIGEGSLGRGVGIDAGFFHAGVEGSVEGGFRGFVGRGGGVGGCVVVVVAVAVVGVYGHCACPAQEFFRLEQKRLPLFCLPQELERLHGFVFRVRLLFVQLPCDLLVLGWRG